MNVLLRKIADDVHNCSQKVSVGIVKDLEFESLTLGEDFARSLVTVAAQYLVEIEKKEEEIKKLRIEISKLYKNYEELRRYYSIPYKTDMQSRKDKGIYPAKKNITVDMIKELMDMGLSQEAVAEKLGVSRSTVCRRLREEKNR